LRADLLGTPVRVTDVAPGLTGGTEFSERALSRRRATRRAPSTGTTPLNADDVADAVHWVATRPAHVNVNFDPNDARRASLRAARRGRAMRRQKREGSA
jgi:3-hydroxy acid dehydrogenase/malonic semialdehyde reductase